MLTIGLFLMVLGYWFYGITLGAFWIALVVLYFKYLMQILENTD